jgi:hypothetical protein
MAENDAKPLTDKQLDRAAELIRIMKVARDNKVWPEYWEADAEMRALLTPASDPL